MTQQKSETYHVEVYTWGTKDNKSNGITNFVDQALFANSTGHASLRMTLPINEQTKGWVEKYCMEETFQQFKERQPKNNREQLGFEFYMMFGKKRIPVQYVESGTAFATLNSQGELEKSNDIAYKSSSYVVDFSAWFNDDNSILLKDLDDDVDTLRHGHHFKYSNDSRKYLQPEQRVLRGKIGSKKMDYSPLFVAHQRDMNNDEFQKMGLTAEGKKIENALNAGSLFMDKLSGLKSKRISGTLAAAAKNLGLDVQELLKEYKTQYPKDQKNLTNFKAFFKDKANQRISLLKGRQLEIVASVGKVGVSLSQEEHVTHGVSPDHAVVLPLAFGSERGLNPEAMLKAMREITEPDEAQFNLYTKNCAKMASTILEAGAEKDPLLKRTLAQNAFGFYGTPQQLYVNAHRALRILDKNQRDNLLRQAADLSELNWPLGKLITGLTNALLLYKQKDSTAGQKTKAVFSLIGSGFGIFLVALLKIPGALIKVLANPIESLNNLLGALKAVIKYANSTPLKIATSVLGIVPLVALAPLALVQMSLKLLAAPFKALINYTSASKIKRIQNKEAQIQFNNPFQKLSTQKAPSNLGLKTVKCATKSHKPEEVLAEFESKLKSTDKPVVLSKKDFQALNKHAQKNKNAEFTSRFKACCNESLNRANKFEEKPSKGAQ
jgi:hypothetical protein